MFFKKKNDDDGVNHVSKTVSGRVGILSRFSILSLADKGVFILGAVGAAVVSPIPAALSLCALPVGLPLSIMHDRMEEGPSKNEALMSPVLALPCLAMCALPIFLGFGYEMAYNWLADKSVTKLISKINSAQPAEDQALLRAAVNGDARAIARALESGANPNSGLAYGFKEVEVDSALTLAVISNKEECVRLLLDAGANPNTDEARYPLKCAIDKDNVKIISMLISAGADPSVKTVESDAISYAMSVSEIPGLASLIDAKRKHYLAGSPSFEIPDSSDSLPPENTSPFRIVPRF